MKKNKPTLKKGHTGAGGMGIEYSPGKAKWIRKQKREEENRWNSLNGPVIVKRGNAS
jgi:hypothetical protein